VEIGAHLETKFAALGAHASQMGDWDFRPMLTRWARDVAADARQKSFPGSDDWDFAEGFKYIRP
jgi:hypothetical protein